MMFYDIFGRCRTQAILICLLPVVMMTGCIVIPVPTGEEPYYAKAIPSLQIGNTSKDEVLTELGVPDATYHRGFEIIYMTTQESWKVAWGFILLTPWAGDAGGGVETLHKRFVLSLSFDSKDTLSEFEFDMTGDDFGDCTSHGICFGQTNAVMRYADSITESTAKDFKPNKDLCSIYLHGLGNKKAYEVSLNGEIPVNVFSTGAFVHWNTKPGPQSLVIFPEPAFLDFDCKASEITFVHFDLKRLGSSRLRLENDATGREHLSNRRLVLLPTR